MWCEVFEEPKHCFHFKRMLFKNLPNAKYSRLNTTTSSVHCHSSKGTLCRVNPIFRFMQINVDRTCCCSDRIGQGVKSCVCALCMWVQLRFSRNLKKLTDFKLTINSSTVSYLSEVFKGSLTSFNVVFKLYSSCL